MTNIFETGSAVIIIFIFLFHPENVFGSEETSRKILEEFLKSPKISDELKLKLRDQNGISLHAVIEFGVGNSKAIEDFKEAPIFSRSDATKGEKISDLVDKLQHQALITQTPVLEHLQFSNVKHVSLWLANEIHLINVDVQIVVEIVSKFDHVSNVRLPVHIPPPKPVEISIGVGIDIKNIQRINNSDVPQPVQQVQARCKDIQCLGEGTVVAVIDTGVLWTHEEVMDNYRRDFGWYDPSGLTEFPFDSDIHGTHVTGIIVGKTKGVAPKGQWIACLGLPEDGSGSETVLKQCGEWAICPFRWNSTQDRNCSAAPDVINNSWGGLQTFTDPNTSNFYYSTVAAWNAAGIISTFSAGNSGPSCTTMGVPGLYDISFSVAAVDNTSTIIGFSSRGPVLNNWAKTANSADAFGTCKQNCTNNHGGGGGGTSGGGGGGGGGSSSFSVASNMCYLTKPEISAPGVNINSSVSGSNSSYELLSGTSMASPMVAGVALLMVCANNHIPGKPPLDVKTAHSVLKSTANTKVINLENGNSGNADPTFTVNPLVRRSHLLCNVGLGICGFPNNLYGHGLVDACKAVKKVKSRH